MLQNIIHELHIYEKKVLKGLEESGYEGTPDEIEKSQNMNIKSVMSAAGSLESKGLIEVHKDVKEVISLSDTGKEYALEGLPERRVLKVLNEEETIPMKDMASKAGLDSSEVNVAIGWLRKKKWASIDKGNVTITEEGRDAVTEEYSDELFLEKVLQVNKLLFFNPTKLFKDGFNLLKKRKGILEVKKEPKFNFKVTEKGKEILELGIEIGEEATQLTHEQLKTGSWRDLKFRGYDIRAEHPQTFPGKMHPLARTINDIRKIFLLMGFTESEGSILESAFWNFDCLFQPQDHAAREMQDTFYIKEPREVNLPSSELVKKVSSAHENGGQTGSEGWGYSWDVDVASQSVLRTHTTCVSVRFLAQNKPPLKMFSVGRVFRRETITYKHLPEFHQVEGIVAHEDITFRNLLGILKEFYHKLGFEVRFRPAYFPYTYLSVECEIYLPHKEAWIELGGAGMFRPEVLEPLGVKTPVAAFGLGIERLAMMRLDIKDIRMLYKSDVGWLRHVPVKLD